MSWLSKAVGKIPVVGKALNTAGKVLPSGGQLLGGGVGGIVGQTIGGHLDPNATDLQKGIGDTVGATAATLGTAGLAGGVGGAGKLGVVGGFLKDHWQDLAKLGLGAGTAYEGYKSNQRANQLTDDALSKLNANPQAPDLSSIFADSGNPYARTRKIPVVGRMT